MLSPVRVTPPDETPVSLAEAKAHLRVDHSDDDARIAALIQAATDHLDGWSGILGRALVTQTWRADFGGWSCGTVRLPLVPVQSVVVAYSDAANVTQTFDAGSYSLHAGSRGAEIILGAGATWPSLYSRSDAARVTFVAGYGDPEDVPEAIKAAILLHVEQLYDGTDRQATRDALLSPYRVPLL